MLLQLLVQPPPLRRRHTIILKRLMISIYANVLNTARENKYSLYKWYILWRMKKIHIYSEGAIDFDIFNLNEFSWHKFINHFFAEFFVLKILYCIKYCYLYSKPVINFYCWAFIVENKSGHYISLHFIFSVSTLPFTA